MYNSVIRQVNRAKTYKFGYILPRTFKEAIELDTLNGNTKWHDAISQEIASDDEYGTFKDQGQDIWEKGKITNGPPGYKKICVHLVFDVKHNGRHKARLVADEHLTDKPV